jgi:hypothetical protein
MLHALSISSSLTWSFCIYLVKVQVMKLLIMQFSPASCHFVSLRSRYSPLPFTV